MCSVVGELFCKQYEHMDDKSLSGLTAAHTNTTFWESQAEKMESFRAANGCTETHSEAFGSDKVSFVWQTCFSAWTDTLSVWQVKMSSFLLFYLMFYF